VQPELAAELGARKAANVAEARADVVVTSNPGCILQIRAAAQRAGIPTRVAHVVELIDASIAGRDHGEWRGAQEDRVHAPRAPVSRVQ
jgi:glycolate oxidase iron-sulfur subunit